MTDREPVEVTGPETQTNKDEQQEDFAALFEATQSGQDRRVQRDTKTEGTVVSIGEEWVFVDVGDKTEGIIARSELLSEDGSLAVQVGDRISAYVVNYRDGEILLSRKMTAAASEEAARDAYRSGVPVEGLVTEERKGGFSVTVFGKPAFCPYSQMDLQSGGNPADYIGKRLVFRVTEYGERGRNIVLSRRDILEEERAKTILQLKSTLKSGDVVEATVRRLAHFGAFADIGGVEGLIPMSELAWHRVGEAAEVLSEGERIKVRILGLDWDHNRISLSLKQTLEDPWDSVRERYSEESSALGTVTRLANFGAFVELEPGVEGLVHISNMGMGRRINHPREVLSEGEQVKVRVLSVDAKARRMGLELIFQAAAGAEAVPDLTEGDIVTGTVESVKDYGVFVALPGGKSGLLHVSEISDSKGGDLRHRFPLGSMIEVQVKGLDPDGKKISLSTKSLKKAAEESQFKEFETGKGGRTSFGKLGDLLKEKLKE